MNYNVQLYTALGEANYTIILEYITVSFVASKLHLCCLKLVPMDILGIQIMTDYETIYSYASIFPLLPCEDIPALEKDKLILNLLNIFPDMLHAKIPVTEVMIRAFNQTRNRQASMYIRRMSCLQSGSQS